jgi:hypothetical protein
MRGEGDPFSSYHAHSGWIISSLGGARRALGMVIWPLFALSLDHLASDAFVLHFIVRVLWIIIGK